MNLELPEITSKYYAKQVVEAILDNPRLMIHNSGKGSSSIPFWIVDAEDVLDILFPEDSDNGH